MENKDWADLFNKFYSRKIDFKKHQQNFTKLAFDVYQMNSSPVESLWILESDPDGNQYLVATYDDNRLEAQSNWSTSLSKEASSIVLYYKNTPITTFAAKDYGFTSDDASIFSRLIVKKAQENPKFVKSVLDAQSPVRREILLNQFPELDNQQEK